MTGRRRRSGPWIKLSVLWSFRLTASEAEAAEEAARAAGISVSDFARDAIAAHVERLRKKVPPDP